jgi:hypothetical protein
MKLREEDKQLLLEALKRGLEDPNCEVNYTQRTDTLEICTDEGRISKQVGETVQHQMFVRWEQKIPAKAKGRKR